LTLSLVSMLQGVLITAIYSRELIVLSNTKGV
jgi:hypothetical protein